MKTQKGFGMIEVMVTAFVMAIAMIAMVTLQLHSIRAAGVANQRFIAQEYAYDIAERIKANEWNANDYNGESTKDAKNCDTVKCTMAQYDMYSFARNLNDVGQVIPQAEGVVNSNGTVWTVTITWNEQTIKEIKQQTFTMDFVL